MKRGDVCDGMLRAAACVDDSESDHHALGPHELSRQLRGQVGLGTLDFHKGLELRGGLGLDQTPRDYRVTLDFGDKTF